MSESTEVITETTNTTEASNEQEHKRYEPSREERRLEESQKRIKYEMEYEEIRKKLRFSHADAYISLEQLAFAINSAVGKMNKKHKYTLGENLIKQCNEAMMTFAMAYHTPKENINLRIERIVALKSMITVIFANLNIARLLGVVPRADVIQMMYTMYNLDEQANRWIKSCQGDKSIVYGKI